MTTTTKSTEATQAILDWLYADDDATTAAIEALTQARQDATTEEEAAAILADHVEDALYDEGSHCLRAFISLTVRAADMALIVEHLDACLESDLADEDESEDD